MYVPMFVEMSVYVYISVCICTVIKKNITLVQTNLNSATIMNSLVVSDMFRNCG